MIYRRHPEPPRRHLLRTKLGVPQYQYYGRGNKTVTVKPSGGDYTSLAAAVLGERDKNPDLVRMGGILTISVEGTWGAPETTTRNLSGFTFISSTTCYMNIVVANSSNYSLEISSTNGGVSTGAYGRIKNLRIKNTNPSVDWSPILTAGGNNGVLDSCRVIGGYSPATYGAIGCTGSGAVVINCQVIGVTGLGFYSSRVDNTYFYNCIAVGNTGLGFKNTSTGQMIIKNCYSGGNTAGNFGYSSTGTFTFTTTYSSDGYAGTSTAAYSTANFTNVTPGAEDLSLPIGSALIGTGTSLSGDSTFPFSWDSSSNTRATWDVGAFYYCGNKTVTVKPSGQGGTYTTLNSAIAGESALLVNLTTAKTILTVSIEGTWSSAETLGTDSAIDISFITNSQCYLNITTDSANRAGTEWNTSKYRFSGNTPGNLLTLRADYTKITGLQVENISVNTAGIGIGLRGFRCSADSCIVKSYTGIAIANYTADSKSVVLNCIAIGCTGAGFSYNNSIVPCYFYNCTSINCGTGFSLSADDVAKNCYAGSNSVVDFTGSTLLTNCASSDTTGSVGLQNITASSAFTDTTVGSEDLSLLAGSALIGVGTSLVADSIYPFNRDITNRIRDGYWDIGSARKIGNKTVTVMPSGGTYTSLASAITGEVSRNPSLLNMEGILIISIEGTWTEDDTDIVDVVGFTTDATHYCKIIQNTLSYRFYPSNPIYAFRNRSNFTRLYGLKVGNSSTGVALTSLAGSTAFINCEVFDGGNAIYCLTNADPKVYIINCVAYGYSGRGLTGSQDPQTVYCYNSVFAGGTYGLYADYAETYNIINCYFGNSSTADLYATSSGVINITTSRTEDGTRSTSTATYSTSTFTNITAGSEDFSLPTGSGLIDIGTDLSDDTYWSFNTDINGATRTGTWDIGAYESLSQDLSASITEAISALDSPTTVSLLPLSLSEIISAIDNPTTVSLLPVTSTDTNTIIDNPSATSLLPLTLTDTNTILDNPTVISLLPISQTETISALDSPSAISLLVANSSEAMSALDSPTTVSLLPLSITEALSALDSPTSISLLPVSISETVSAIDLAEASSQGYITATITETAFASSTLTPIQTLIASIQETSNAVEISSNILTAIASIIESTLADSTQSGTVFGLFVVDHAETASAIDTPTATSIRLASIQDINSLIDNPSSTKLSPALIDELAPLYDTIVGSSLLPVSISDITLISDSETNSLLASALLSENTNLIDSIGTIATLISSIVESGSAWDHSTTGTEAYPVFVLESTNVTDSITFNVIKPLIGEEMIIMAVLGSPKVSNTNVYDKPFDNFITTYQSRLGSKGNRISQKLQNNSIRLTGVASDCIRISLKLTAQGDIISRRVEDIDVVSVVFPAMLDIPLRKTKHASGKIIVAPYTMDSQPIEVSVPLSTNLDQDDLLFKFYDNSAGEDPMCCIYQVKDLLGSFGARKIIYNKYKLTYFDGNLPDTILNWAFDIARRREVLEW